MTVRIENISTAHYTIPTDRPEADGTLEWDSTTIVLAFINAAGRTGMGYTYAHRSAADLIMDKLAPVLAGRDPLDIPARWHDMRHAARNIGVRGQAAAAIAALDTALWDLKAGILGIPLVHLMGRVRESFPVYGSGGFTTYDRAAIRDQIGNWKKDGITMAKIKIGAAPEDDVRRVEWARQALAPGDRLFVDANGAYTVKQALGFAEKFRTHGVFWFEEPVSSDNLDGLRLLRENGPPAMDIAAGEYGYDLFYFHRMLEAGAVDVLQLDATRCEGYSGFIHAASLAMAYGIPVSAHCAPALHMPVACHVPHFLHQEYFYDHTRIENMIFDGVPAVADGRLTAQTDRPGHGLTLRRQDAERCAS
jgi:L-alanine-DL-glutamate epimerase-like enolase superfamily enzyme